MPEDHPAPVVIWEERPRGLDWAWWTILTGVTLALTVAMGYMMFRAPLPVAYRVLTPFILAICGVFAIMLVRRVLTSKPGRITLDIEHRKLYAENMILHRGFWPPRRTPLYVCELSDVRSFRLPSSRYVRRLHIDCTGGRLCIDDVSASFDELVRGLRKHVRQGPTFVIKDFIMYIVATVCASMILWACVHFGWF